MERLKDLRTEKGLTTSALGKIVGCSNPTITHYERGDREPSLEMLCKLADFFGVSVDYLIGHEKKSVMERPTSELAENFIKEFGDLFSDKTFHAYAELYRFMDEKQKIFIIGMIVGYLQDQGKKINIKF